MTAVLIVSLYFIALTAFLGMDILAKVPVTMYALVLAALGTLCAAVVVGAFHVTAGQAATPGDHPLWFGIAAAGFGAAAAGVGLAALGRLVVPFARAKSAAAHAEDTRS